MAIWRFVNLDLPEAKLLADLTGILNDLKATIDICDLFLQERSRNAELILLESLIAAVVVRYARSFKSGVRSRVPTEILDNLTDEQKNIHDWIIGLRDKYVAHSVNAFEENTVVAYLVPEERGPKNVSSISVQQQRLVSLSNEEIAQLKSLSIVISENVTKLLELENKKVLEIARTLPMEELYNQKAKAPKLASRKDVLTPRKRH